MSESGGDARASEQPPGDDDDVTHIHQEARASGGSSIIQSGRDTHYYLGDGVRRRQRTDGPVVDECPYPGLAAFTTEQARWFFGRDRLVAEIATRLDGRRAGGGPLIVVAASGAGKSSLFQAGLIPALARGALPGGRSREWPRLIFTPTSHPITQVAARITSVAGAEPESVAAELAADPGRASAILRDALTAYSSGGSDDVRTVVVVDQLEELFTLCTDEAERRGFIELLAWLSDAPAAGTPAALVICGLRADFYAPCTQYPLLRAALQSGQILLGPMSETELREAIIYPARSVGLDLEPGLVELLLRDIGATEEGAAGGPGGGYEAGRLPLLAHALRAIWQQRHGSTMTVDAYRATGGIEHAVGLSAELVFGGLGPPAQDTARRLFLRLVKIGESPVEDTRRRATRGDILGEFTEPGAARAVLDAFTGARLFTQDQDTVEITHEALLRAWPRLRQWIDTDRAGSRIYQQLEDDAASWDRQRRDPSALYRGTRLATARAWSATAPHGPGLSPAATAFLDASNRQERRTARTRRAAVVVLAVLALLASGAAAFGLIERASAQGAAAVAIAQRNQARSAAAALGADAQYGNADSRLVAQAAQLGLAAYKLAPTPEAYGSVLNATSNILTGQRAVGYTNALAFNSAGSLLVTSSASAFQLWHITPARLTDPVLLDTVPIGHPTGGSPGIWFDPGHNTMALLYGNGVALANSGGSPAAVTLRNQHSATPYTLGFSHDGRLLAVGQSDGTVQLWNTANPAVPVTIGQSFADPGAGHDSVSAVAFSADNAILATLSGPFHGNGNIVAMGTVRLWNIADPANPRLLPATNIVSIPTVLAFSPAGRTLATSEGNDDTVRLWNVTNSSRPKPLGRPLSGHNGTVIGVAFSPDGRTLATASMDNSVRLWNVSVPGDPVSVAVLGKESTTVAFSEVAFGPDGLLAATAGTILNGSSAALRTWLWETNPALAAARICAVDASPPITRTQWQHYFPGQPYDLPCPVNRG